MDAIYQQVTDLFAQKLDVLFESEDTLKAKFEELFPSLKFDRTDHWGGILARIFSDCWKEAGPEVKSEPVMFDRLVVLKLLQNHPLMDYNLFTQVMLNLQTIAVMAYQARDAEAEIEAMKAAWPKESKLQPFEPKARMVKEASTEEDKEYNLAISTVRTLNIIAKFTPQVSFRVSPKGSTPALVDSNNLSSLGIGSDKYLRVMPSLKAWYIHWVPQSGPLLAVPGGVSGVAGTDDWSASFWAPGIKYPFHSKSGGEILQEVLFSRLIAKEVFAKHDVTVETCVIIPRMSSVLVVADEYGMNVKDAFYSLRTNYPMLELSEGSRVN